MNTARKETRYLSYESNVKSQYFVNKSYVTITAVSLNVVVYSLRKYVLKILISTVWKLSD